MAHRIADEQTEVSFWKRTKTDGNVASDEENANYCEIHIRGHIFPSFILELPRQRHELTKLQAFARYAFELGRADKLREINQVLAKP